VFEDADDLVQVLVGESVRAAHLGEGDATAAGLLLDPPF
jgi:hypothetical protein